MSTEAMHISAEEDFNPSELKDFLNDHIGKKTSGKEFTHQDIQQYVMRGRLPEEYGGFDIAIKYKTKYITVLTVKGLRKKWIAKTSQ